MGADIRCIRVLDRFSCVLWKEYIYTEKRELIHIFNTENFPKETLCAHSVIETEPNDREKKNTNEYRNHINYWYSFSRSLLFVFSSIVWFSFKTYTIAMFINRRRGKKILEPKCHYELNRLLAILFLQFRFGLVDHLILHLQQSLFVNLSMVVSVSVVAVVLLLHSDGFTTHCFVLFYG